MREAQVSYRSNYIKLPAAIDALKQEGLDDHTARSAIVEALRDLAFQPRVFRVDANMAGERRTPIQRVPSFSHLTEDDIDFKRSRTVYQERNAFGETRQRACAIEIPRTAISVIAHGQTNDVLKDEGSASQQASAKKGGRPANPSWDAFWVEVCGRIHDDGRPVHLQPFARELVEWWQEHLQTEPPEQRTIEKKLRPLWDRIPQDGD
jgi:hypothetical protein